MRLIIPCIILMLCGCSTSHLVKKEIRNRYNGFHHASTALNIDSLVLVLNPLSAREREKIIVPLMLAGNIPAFNLKFKLVRMQSEDSSRKKYTATVFVSPDYLSIGNNNAFMRMPLTPQAAQVIADSLHAMLPTKKIVDAIYQHAAIRLEPQPITEARDSLSTFLRHHRIIQEQLNFKYNGQLLAGIKKDVVRDKAAGSVKPGRVNIYGWHKLNGEPIQPLYSGHADWYVDYSHGIRLLYEKMIINGKVLMVRDVLNDPVLSKLIR